MYKNAGIKTIREAIARLMDGEVFYSQNGSKIFFIEETDDSPFRIFNKDSNNDEQLSLFVLRTFKDWKIKTDWRDNVSEENPVLCLVWNDNNPKKIVAVEEFDINDKSYYANRHRYTNATPLTKQEALKYIVEE